MSRAEVDGLNAGYAALLLEQYLDNPGAVSSEWRALFETAPEEELLALQPGLALLFERLERNGGDGHAPVAPAPVALAPVALAPAPVAEPPPAPAAPPPAAPAP